MESRIHDSCFECTLRPDRLFCDLPADALEAFNLIKCKAQQPRGTVLFRQGQPAHAIQVVCDGRVRLSLGSESGKRVVFRTVGPGEILGLSAVLAGGNHEVSAETVDACSLATVKRKDLLRFLRQHREACLQVVNLLSQDLHVAYDRVRSIGLGRTRRSRAVHIH
ncbi:MAG TPA: Crp/Fnr family transcriptional regulator [Terriglobales bacterium]|jgi:CRP/FNR family transcriptional regulator